MRFPQGHISATTIPNAPVNPGPHLNFPASAESFEPAQLQSQPADGPMVGDIKALVSRAVTNEVTLLLEGLARGDGTASEELLPLVYEELRSRASRLLAREAAGQTLQATALVHEAWLRLVGAGDRNWNNRVHFFRVAALAMRRILVDRARYKASVKHGSGHERVNIKDVELEAAQPDERILLIDEALTRLEEVDPESAKLTTLKFFGGFTNREVAEIQGVTERTIERKWAYAKASLFKLIKECAI
jgi:RNA polymerase sigma factor (TIGR02999 family)